MIEVYCLSSFDLNKIIDVIPIKNEKFKLSVGQRCPTVELFSSELKMSVQWVPIWLAYPLSHIIKIRRQEAHSAAPNPAELFVLFHLTWKDIDHRLVAFCTDERASRLARTIVNDPLSGLA